MYTRFVFELYQNETVSLSLSLSPHFCVFKHMATFHHFNFVSIIQCSKLLHVFLEPFRLLKKSIDFSAIFVHVWELAQFISTDRSRLSSSSTRSTAASKKHFRFHCQMNRCHFHLYSFILAHTHFIWFIYLSKLNITIFICVFSFCFRSNFIIWRLYVGYFN